MSDRTHADHGVDAGAGSFRPGNFSTTAMRRYARAIGRAAVLGAVRSSRWRGHLIPIERIAFWVAAVGLVGLFFWQIFVTLPHLGIFSGDTLSYNQKEPQRGVGVYYFLRMVYLVWHHFYAVAVAQGLLLGAVGLLLAYAIRRATGSGLLALAVLIVCLFKESLVVLTQDLASDSLFATACLGLLAAALLVWERASPARIVLFLLFAFAATIVRSVGMAVLWPMVFALAFRLWATQRRALAAIVAGCIGVYGVNATIGFINYGFWGTQAQMGLALICGATFVADENVPPGVPYPHKFAAATVQARSEYEKASTWWDKYETVDQYYCSPSWRIARQTLVFGDDFSRSSCAARTIASNELYRRTALTVILHNPLGYLKLTLVKLVAGIQMLSSYDNQPMWVGFTPEQADFRAAQVEGIIRDYSQPDPGDCARPDLLLTLMKDYVDDWRNTPLALKMDFAKPLRNLFDLVKGSTIDRLFVGLSVIVLGLAAGATLRRKQMGDGVTLLLLLVLPVWGYLLALCLVISPILRYLDATSTFVYIALLVGIWSLVAGALNRIRNAVVPRPRGMIAKTYPSEV